MMKKGLTGKVLTTILSLIVGILALALIFLFLSKSTGVILEGAKKAVLGIRCKLLCYEVFGKDMGMCSGC